MILSTTEGVAWTYDTPSFSVYTGCETLGMQKKIGPVSQQILPHTY